MKIINYLIWVIVSISLFMSCNEEVSESAMAKGGEGQMTEELRQKIIEMQNVSFKERGGTTKLEGLLNMPYSEQAKAAVSQDEEREQTFYDLFDRKLEDQSWSALNTAYREFLEANNQDKASEFFDQMLSMRALSLMLQSDLDSDLDEVAYYVELLLKHQNGNAYLIGKSLEKLVGHWEAERITIAANQTLSLPGLPSEEKLDKHENSGRLYFTKTVAQHREGIEILNRMKNLLSREMNE